MRNAKRGRGSYRVVSMVTVVAGFGLALSACGGSGGASSGVEPTAPAGPPSAAATGDNGSASSAGTSTSPATSSVTTSSPTTSTIVHGSAVTLNWLPPTANTNGSGLADLAGYTIYYGTQSGDYTRSIAVDNPGIATYVVDGLAPGTYYFAVVADNSRGTESPLSGEVIAKVE
jgi:hypothetical protein